MKLEIEEIDFYYIKLFLEFLRSHELTKKNKLGR